jgi:hypothetical protein
MPPAIKVRCPLCGHLVFVRNFERGPYPLEAFEVSGLGRGRGFSHKRIKISLSVRELVMRKLKEVLQHLERVVELVAVDLSRRVLYREMWIPLVALRVVREHKIPIGGGVRIGRG